MERAGREVSRYLITDSSRPPSAIRGPPSRLPLQRKYEYELLFAQL